MNDTNQQPAISQSPYGNGDLSTPESLAQASKTLYAALLAKNRVSVGEFAEYEPLFGNPKESHLSVKQLVLLAEQYAARFDQFNPIYVLSGPDGDPKTKIIRVIPARFKRIGVINDLGEVAETQASVFNNVMRRPVTPLSLEHAVAKSRMSAVIAQLLDETTPKSTVAFEKKLIASISPVTAPPSDTPSKQDINDFLDTMQG